MFIASDRMDNSEENQDTKTKNQSKGITFGLPLAATISFMSRKDMFALMFDG